MLIGKKDEGEKQQYLWSVFLGKLEDYKRVSILILSWIITGYYGSVEYLHKISSLCSSSKLFMTSHTCFMISARFIADEAHYGEWWRWKLKFLRGRSFIDTSEKKEIRETLLLLVCNKSKTRETFGTWMNKETKLKGKFWS